MTDQNEVIEPEVMTVPPQQQVATTVAPIGNGIVAAPQTREDMEAMMERAELAIEFQNRIKIAALKLTNENDWCKLGKKFFLENTGAKKMMQAFGVSVYPDGPATSVRHEDDKGEYIIVTVSMRALWHGSEVTEKGVCSTRDKLFGTVNGGYRPLSEVNLVNVTLKAHTGAIRRAVTTVLALNPTEEDMKSADLDLQKIENDSGVSYGAGTRGGNTDSKEVAARKAEVGRKLMEMYDDKKTAADALEFMTSFKGNDGEQVKGRRTMKAVSEKQLFYVEKDVNAEYAKFQALQDQAGGGE